MYLIKHLDKISTHFAELVIHVTRRVFNNKFIFRTTGQAAGCPRHSSDVRGGTAASSEKNRCFSSRLKKKRFNFIQCFLSAPTALPTIQVLELYFEANLFERAEVHGQKFREYI